MQREDAMKRYREKMAIYQLKRETWKRSFPPDFRGSMALDFGLEAPKL